MEFFALLSECLEQRSHSTRTNEETYNDMGGTGKGTIRMGREVSVSIIIRGVNTEHGIYFQCS